MHHLSRSSRHPEATLRLARMLGWFSIGLGVAELLAPRQVGSTVGMEERARLVRLYGGREIAQGLGILLARDPAPWVWARVAGDALDMGTLVTASRARPKDVAVALGVLATIGLVDLYCARRLTPMPVQDPERLADYRSRSGFPRPPEQMRGKGTNGRLALKEPQESALPSGLPQPVTPGARWPGG